MPTYSEPQLRQAAVEQAIDLGDISNYEKGIKLAQKGYELTEELLKEHGIEKKAQEKKQLNDTQFSEMLLAQFNQYLDCLGLLRFQQEKMTEKLMENDERKKDIPAEATLVHPENQTEKEEKSEGIMKFGMEQIDSFIHFIDDLYNNTVGMVKEELLIWRDKNQHAINQALDSATKDASKSMLSELQKNPDYQKYADKIKAVQQDPDLHHQFVNDPGYRNAKQMSDIVAKITHPDTARKSVGSAPSLAEAVAHGAGGLQDVYSSLREKMPAENAEAKTAILHAEKQGLLAEIRQGLKPSEIRALNQAKLGNKLGGISKNMVSSVNKLTQNTSYALLEAKHQLESIKGNLTEAKTQLSNHTLSGDLTKKLMGNLSDTMSLAQKFSNFRPKTFDKTAERAFKMAPSPPKS
jgi:hypothetical protein